MDLLHLDFTKIEVSGDREKELKKKPEVVNVLVVHRPLHPTHHGLCDRGCDHSTLWPVSCTTTTFTSLVLRCVL